MTIIDFPCKRPSSCLGKLEIVYHPSLWSTSTEFNNYFLPKVCSLCRGKVESLDYCLLLRNDPHFAVLPGQH